MKKLRSVKSEADLAALVQEVGFLPLVKNELSGFSVEELAAPEINWFDGNPETSPWEWRYTLSIRDDLAYAKFFRGKAGFVSIEWLPVLANYRRDGYDFDALYEDGKANRRTKLIMDLFPGGEALPSYIIKERAGFGKGGERGFDGAINTLMMQTYLITRGFARKRNRNGEEYGWPVALYSRPEAVFGYEHIRSQYDCPPGESFERLAERCKTFVPDVGDEAIRRFLSNR